MDFYDDFEIDSSLDVALADDFLTSIEEDEAVEKSVFDEDIDCDDDEDEDDYDEDYDHYAFDPKAYLKDHATIELVNEILDEKGVSDEERQTELYYFNRINYLQGDSPLPVKLTRLILGETTMEQYYIDYYKSIDTPDVDTSALDMSIEDLLD